MANNFLALVEDRRPDIESLLPSYMTPARFFALIRQIEKNPKLMECTPESLLECVIKAAECGFEIGGPDDHCYLIPYGKQAQLQAGYKGMIYRLVQAHAASHIFADVVREGDLFKVISGTKRELIHEPGEKRGKTLKVYAVAVLPNGITDFEVLEPDDIEAIKRSALNISKDGKPSPAWRAYENEMLKKSAIKRLGKRLQGDRRGSPDELDRLRATMELKADIDIDRIKQAEAANADLAEPPNAAARKVKDVEIVPDKKSDAQEPLSGDDEDMLLAAFKKKGIKASGSDAWLAEHCFEDLGIQAMSEMKKGQIAAVLSKLEC